MKSWPKDAKEFAVLVMHSTNRRTCYSYMPKPTLQAPGNPDRLKFVSQDGCVEVRGSD